MEFIRKGGVPSAKFFTEEAEAIAAHNRVSRAFEIVKKGETK